jgi:GT2 family glycosyltransferase
MIDVGIVVLSYGAANKQAQLVESLVESAVSPSRILVVHNPDGSSEGARPAVRPGVVVCPQTRNKGYGPAMNTGIEHWLARGLEWVLLLTHDVQFERQSLEGLLAAGARNPSYGVLGPALVNAETGRPFSYGGIDLRENIVGHRLDPPASDHDVAPCAWVDGSVMLVRARAYREAGPIESRFFMYFEEPDFCLRMRRAGWWVGVALGASARTDPGLPKRPLAYGYLFCRNGLRYAWRTGGPRRVASAVASQLRMSWYLAAKPYNRRFYDRTFRRMGWPAAAGIWLGLLGAARGQSGPPPALVRHLTDIGGT